MINPSIHGWIDKFFVEQKHSIEGVIIDEISLYDSIKKTGFIFGHIVNVDTRIPIPIANWLPTEISKISLLNTLFKMHCLVNQSVDTAKFTSDCVSFYKNLNPKSSSIFTILSSQSSSSNLEEIIHTRVQTNEDIFSKNFSHVITNALSFIDVLAFKKYLELGEIPEKYSNKIEEIVINVVSISLKSKTGISVHDELLQKLFESSVRYNKFSSVTSKNIESIDLSYLENVMEKLYIIDLAGISLWSDEKVENEERYFMYKLGEKLDLPETTVLNSIDYVNYFIVKYKSEIPYFNFSNPVKHFYDNTTESVSVLITRNKKRLVKEIQQSKELMQLLAKSTHKDLDKEEKKKIKKQLLDICKTVPSLTIFLLPGGALLLPILIKFIPKMLPSAFNENSDDDL
ncbi:LETM1-related biofilm-associated protein [Flavobacterium dankookense]|uniref:LETM1-like protein n=1 Tax=Flavobacterium dankookense TaxID=706186 RepID=A0A4R6QF60_9FLAO|nr:LETM1-related biofilm-associated protein [Flavobacterium dankookense]TDP60907.1 LETM1-like protein [Flavobacterium dankookense]